MYKIDRTTGTIIFPDGYELPVPYEPIEKYLEYAAWIQSGNEPKLVGDEPIDT